VARDDDVDHAGPRPHRAHQGPCRARRAREPDRAIAEGEISPELDPADYARYIMTVLEGLSVQAAGGASREDLHKVADMTLRTWPA